MEKAPNQTSETKINSLLNSNLSAMFMGKTSASTAILQHEHQATYSKPLSENSEQPPPTEAVAPRTSHTKKSNGTDTKKEPPYQPFTVICDKELVRKVKAIAAREGLHINDVVQTMYEEGISRYEQTHGPVDFGPKKKSAKDILFAT